MSAETEILRGGLMEVYARWESIDWRRRTSGENAMATAALSRLVEAFPDDHLYPILLNQVRERARLQAARTGAG